MTWEKIYQRFQRGKGEKWATLSEKCHPLFEERFKRCPGDGKKVLDIGCGTGKYLYALQQNGFEVEGVDSSKTAVRLARKLLGKEVRVHLEEMFDFQLRPNGYDVILSISAIHHGSKSQVKKLLEKVWSALKADGLSFVTFPDWGVALQEKRLGELKEVSPGTYIPLSGPEKGVPHSFYTKEELEGLFSLWTDVVIELDDVGRWVVCATR